MPAAQLRAGWGRALRRSWAPTLLCCAGLVLGDGGRAVASEMVFGGRVTASGKTTESDTSPDSEQRSLTTTIDGVGYIWRPWFATVGLTLNASQALSHVEAGDGTGARDTRDDFLSGEARMNLFPRSRFPMRTFVEVADSRVETDTVGVPLDEINTLRRERVGVTQQYRPVSGTSNYAVQMVHTRIFEQDAQEERSEDVSASGAHRLNTHSLNYRINRRETVRDEGPDQRNDTFSTVTLRHGFQPSAALTVDSSLDVFRDEERVTTPEGQQGLATSEGFRTSEDAGSFDSTLSWRPKGSNLTLRGSVGAQRRERTADAAASHDDGENASAGITYEVTPSLRVTTDAGVERSSTDGVPESERRFQNAGMEYAPTAIPSGEFKYHWGATGSVGNTDATNEESVQTSNVGIRHGVDRVVSYSRGVTESLSLSQGGSRFRNSKGTELVTVTHLASSAVHWSGETATRRVQINLSDSRTTGQDAEAEQDPEVDQQVRTANVLGSRQFSTGRFSSLEGSLSLGTTRVLDSGDESRFSFAHLSAGYTHNNAFGAPRLRFRSRLEFAANRAETAGAAETGDERASWDNRLDYTIGLLTLALRRTLTEINGAQTLSHVLSASRVF